MGHWKIEISGTGTHDNGKSGDADTIARVLVALLKAHAQNVGGARFVLTDFTGKEHVSTDLLVALPEQEPIGERAQPEHIAQFFAWEHLPAPLAAVSSLFGHLATSIVDMLPRNPERTVALRKLLEAKDAAVRARVAK